jgi:predicted enzyme related to lactoylglutathione lyase
MGPGGPKMMRSIISPIEWSSTDLEKTKNFLSKLFNWEFHSWGEDYLIFTTSNGIPGVISKKTHVNPVDAPLVYVDVEEMEPYLEKTLEYGGNIVYPINVHPTGESHAYLKDPDGNIVGLYEPSFV